MEKLNSKLRTFMFFRLKFYIYLYFLLRNSYYFSLIIYILRNWISQTDFGLIKLLLRARESPNKYPTRSYKKNRLC